MIERVLRDFAFAKWLEQLRRPESKKHTLRLFPEDAEKDDHETACCLGHACKAIIPNRIKWREGDDGVGPAWVADGIGTYLPPTVAKLLNITRRGMFITEHRSGQGVTYKKLTEINDFTSMSPQEIADVIEEKYRNNEFVPRQQGVISE